MIHFSSANYIASMFWSAPSLILPIMVLYILGAELNAYFYIAWSVGNLLHMIPQAISTSIFAEGSYDKQRLGADTRRSLKLTFLILVPAVIIIVIFGDKLLLLFGASYSAQGTMLLRMLVFSAFPAAINYSYLSVKRVEKKLAVIIGLSAFIAVSTLTLSYLLLPRMGIDGIGIAWLGTQGVVALVIIAGFLRQRKINHRLNT
jgi:O-antigen/teichoic acid export membrane protein